MISNVFQSGELGRLSGINIYKNPLCTEWLPTKKHVKKRWMTDAYHNRIQKKWVKRFGHTEKPAAYMTPSGLICHPDIYEQIKKSSSGGDE